MFPFLSKLIASLQRRAERSCLRVRVRMRRENKNIAMLDSEGTEKDYSTENSLPKTLNHFSTGFSLIFWNQLRKEDDSCKVIQHWQK